jgi:[acyl-carrier-protein] S-malonyltransferase
MHRAATQSSGAMAAVLGLAPDALRAAVARAVESGAGRVQLANFNAPGQIVISGDADAVRIAGEYAMEAGAKRVVPLNVSAAFHTPVMAPAAERLRAALERIEWRSPRIPVMANLTGRPHQGGERIPQVMEMQLRSPVRWADCVGSLVQSGCDMFVEVGPKRALTGMMRELAPGAAAIAVGTPAACQELTIPT